MIKSRFAKPVNNVIVSGMTPADILTCRQQHGFTRAQLAAQLQVSRVIVYYWETGKRKIGPWNTQKLEKLVENEK